MVTGELHVIIPGPHYDEGYRHTDKGKQDAFLKLNSHAIYPSHRRPKDSLGCYPQSFERTLHHIFGRT